ncbi:MAG: ATP-binding protein [Flavobacteriales bacterium]
MRVQTKYRNIILLGIIFLVLISTLIYIGDTARKRFDEIIETLIEDKIETGPEHDVRTVQSLLDEIELAVKVYILTNEDEPLLQYYDLNFKMLDQFEQIAAKSATYSPEVKQAIDSLEAVTFRRIRIFEDLVNTRDEFRVQKAMNKVEHALEVATLEMSALYADTIQSERGKARALRRLFTKEKQKEVYDSRKKKIPNSIVQEFKVNLHELSKEESQKESDLRQRNLEVTANGEFVRQQVDSLVNVVAELRLRKNLARQAHIEELAAASSRTVTYTVIAAIAFILVFAYLIFLQIQSTNRFIRASKAASDKALDLARSKENFITNVSHELRTPLNAIIGFSELNEREKDQIKKAEYNRIVKESGQHLKSLINDLLDWSKIESGQFTFEKKPFDPQVVLSEVREIVYSQHHDSSVRFTLRSNIKNTRLLGDSVRLKQVLINILNNAFKFTDEGEVRLVMEETRGADDKSMLRITITDTGIGISETDLPKIFQDFKQVDSERNRKYEGSGLGLAITKRIITQQGGTIRVQSQLGKGTTFTVEIPYEIGTSAGIKTDGNNIQVTSQRLKVLIADDSLFNRKLLISILDQPNIEVFEADSGETALELFQKTYPDLCLFDIKMPGMDGIELATKITELNLSHPPILFALTAADSPEMNASCQAAGYKAVLPKPLDQMALFRLINENFDAHVDDGHHKSKKPTKAFDAAVVNRIFEDDFEFRNEMLGVFLESMSKEFAKLNQAVEDKDLTAIDDITHKTLPSCRHIGAEALVVSLESLRNSARNNGDISELKVMFIECSNHYLSVSKVIQGIIA